VVESSWFGCTTSWPHFAVAVVLGREVIASTSWLKAPSPTGHISAATVEAATRPLRRVAGRPPGWSMARYLFSTAPIAATIVVTVGRGAVIRRARVTSISMAAISTTRTTTVGRHRHRQGDDTTTRSNSSASLLPVCNQSINSARCFNSAICTPLFAQNGRIAKQYLKKARPVLSLEYIK